MFKFFNSDVFVEIGEAIGNVSERVFPHRSAVDSVERAFRRRLNEADPMDIPVLDEPRQYPRAEILDIPFVVLESDEKETNR